MAVLCEEKMLSASLKAQIGDVFWREHEGYTTPLLIRLSRYTASLCEVKMSSASLKAQI